MTEPTDKSLRWLPILGLLACGLVWSGCRSVEPVYRNTPAASDTREADPYVDTHIYQLGELVKIFYRGRDGTPEFREERINGDGILSLPGIGSVAAGGKTPRQIQEELQKKYPSYFGHPERSRVYYVGGQVRTPGPKAYMGKTTVSTAIQAAGDFTDFANKKKVVLISSDGRREIINVVDLLKGIDPPNDPPVYPGDRIEVPRRAWRF